MSGTLFSIRHYIPKYFHGEESENQQFIKTT